MRQEGRIGKVVHELQCIEGKGVAWQLTVGRYRGEIPSEAIGQQGSGRSIIGVCVCSFKSYQEFSLHR